jgi:hypothetical protein
MLSFFAFACWMDATSSGNGSDEPAHFLLVKLYRMSDPTKNAGAFYFHVLPSTIHRGAALHQGFGWSPVATGQQVHGRSELQLGAPSQRDSPSYRRLAGHPPPLVKDRLDAFAKGQMDEVDLQAHRPQGCVPEKSRISEEARSS